MNEFVHGSLDRETREFIEDREPKIHQFADGMPKLPFAYLRPTGIEIVMMGGLLCDIKADLDHGKFIDWVKAECHFSYRTAHRYMRVYRAGISQVKRRAPVDSDNHLIMRCQVAEQLSISVGWVVARASAMNRTLCEARS
jgi:hypothetical protein